MSATSQALTRVAPGELASLDAQDGREVAGLAEALYMRLFTLALGGLQITCGLAIAAALVRTDHANFVRTAGLALGIALIAALALRASPHTYWAMRRRPLLSLTGPVLALAALSIDGVSHSPLSFAAAASIALPAFVCGRRWALAAATLIAIGAVGAAMLHLGVGALNSVGQGSVAYFVWALVLSGLAEAFARLSMRMPKSNGPQPAPDPPPPIRVPNLADDPPSLPPNRTAPPPSPRPEPTPDSGVRLAARQLQVIALLADGLRANDIAQQLGIAPATVYRYVQQAKQRAGVSSRYELVAFAARHGLLQTNERR